ncbi:hypothetical protein JCGZ_00018 [Jatropha curcas]|uniref:Glycosyl transferase CAP10 domain-containing protein n=1 Tax=Jatropha curcas TaxID=180498 RepID=A0A067JL17_JATCU|nr:hypothetical protein JCGZ_00018 [Jatropha curcas]
MTTTRGPLQMNSFVSNILKRPQPKCTNNSMSTNCITNYQSSTATCPDHFRWIHEDLRPWKSSGISKEMVEKAKESADFRLVIVNGKIYVEKYNDAFQTRDVFTIWGFLQLLMFYPGKVPDLELMFNCGDRPQIYRNDYQGSNATSLPVMFQYCGTRGAPVVLFPDWSFWGW